MTSEEITNVLKMSLQDILNELCNQMEKKGVNKEWIGFDAINGIDNKKYRLKVTLEVIE